MRTLVRDLVAAPPPLHRPPWPKLWISHLWVEAREVGKGKKIHGKRGEARGLVLTAPLLAIAGRTLATGAGHHPQPTAMGGNPLSLDLA
jgi:hypothetical protein